MMLKEAGELKGTAVFRVSRRQGMEIKTEAIVNAITRSQKQSSRPSGPDPATTVASPTVPYQGFQSTPVGTLKPKARPVVPHGEGVISQNWDRHYRNSMSFSEGWKAFKDPSRHWNLG